MKPIALQKMCRCRQAITFHAARKRAIAKVSTIQQMLDVAGHGASPFL